MLKSLSTKATTISNCKVPLINLTSREADIGKKAQISLHKSYTCFLKSFYSLNTKNQGSTMEIQNLPYRECKGHSSHSMSPKNTIEKVAPTFKFV